jgi:hypothetical protein
VHRSTQNYFSLETTSGAKSYLICQQRLVLFSTRGFP